MIILSNAICMYSYRSVSHIVLNVSNSKVKQKEASFSLCNISNLHI